MEFLYQFLLPLAQLILYGVFLFTPLFLLIRTIYSDGPKSETFPKGKSTLIASLMVFLWLMFVPLNMMPRDLILVASFSFLATVVSFYALQIERVFWFSVPVRANKQTIVELGDGIDEMKPIGHFSALKKDHYDLYLKYYEISRDEIQREDGITRDRLSLTLTFQAFLVAGLVFLTNGMLTHWVSIGGSGGESVNGASLIWVAGLMALLITFCGFGLSIHSYLGVRSSRKSLMWAKDSWIKFNSINGRLYPSILPQLTKRSNRPSISKIHIDRGTDFALSIPAALAFFWLSMYWVWGNYLIFQLGFFDCAGNLICQPSLAFVVR